MSGPGVVHWEHLTEVERTCLEVAFGRWHTSADGSIPCCWPDGTPWYSDPLGPLFVAGIPPDQQHRWQEGRLKGDSWMRNCAPQRTTEVDHQLQAAVHDSPIQQMVLLGAGMDTRAWRLQWPPGFSVFEVDSQQVLDFKHRILQGGGISATTEHQQQQQQQQQQEEEGGARGSPLLSCQQRVAVVADASQPEEMWARLLSAGLSVDTPTVYVLEGFIGYLEMDAGNALLQLLALRSALGSRIIMTAPPTPAQRTVGQDVATAAAAAKSAAGGTLSAAGEAATAAAAAATAAAAAAVRKPDGEGWRVDEKGVRVYRTILHHTTFEEPTVTLARLCAAGWHDCKLLTADELGAKYSIQKAQPILLGGV